MPGYDGIEATRAIRAVACERRVPIIALTPSPGCPDRETCLESGVDDRLLEPMRPADAAALLARWCPEPATV